MPSPGAALQEGKGIASPPDPSRRFSAPLYKGFVRYLKWYVRRHFHAVLVSSDGLPRVPAGRPLVIYSNHPSWWDPLLFMLIGDALFPGRRGFGPMEAQSLKRYAIFERLGAFGVDLDCARGGVSFMVQGKRILADPTNILWLTAEGAFTDIRHRPVRIEQGLGFLARMAAGVIVLPLALEYPFWNESRPVALCRFGDPIDVHRRDAGSLGAAQWNALFERALSDTMDRLSHESMQRSAAPFRSLLQGTAGVGGLYDWGRRLRAWSRGRGFDASHGQPK